MVKDHHMKFLLKKLKSQDIQELEENMEFQIILLENGNDFMKIIN